MSVNKQRVSITSHTCVCVCIPPPMACFACRGAAASVCTGCRVAVYCDAACQRLGWQEHGHSLSCRLFAAQGALAAQGVMDLGNLIELPPEMLAAVHAHLPMADMARLMRVNKHMQAALEVRVWQAMIRRDLRAAHGKGGAEPNLQAVLEAIDATDWTAVTADEARGLYSALIDCTARAMTSAYIEHWREVREAGVRAQRGDVQLGSDDAYESLLEEPMYSANWEFQYSQWAKIPSQTRVRPTFQARVAARKALQARIDAVNEHLRGLSTFRMLRAQHGAGYPSAQSIDAALAEPARKLFLYYLIHISLTAPLFLTRPDDAGTVTVIALETGNRVVTTGEEGVLVH